MCKRRSAWVAASRELYSTVPGHSVRIGAKSEASGLARVDRLQFVRYVTVLTVSQATTYLMLGTLSAPMAPSMPGICITFLVLGDSQSFSAPRHLTEPQSCTRTHFQVATVYNTIFEKKGASYRFQLSCVLGIAIALGDTPFSVLSIFFSTFLSTIPKQTY